MIGLQRQMLRFAMIGVASTALYFGLLIVLRPIIGSIIVLTAVCYAVAMGLNFLAQGFFTFEVQRPSSRQMSRYVVMHGSALVANSLAMAGLVDALGVNLLVAQICVTGCITCATFLVSKLWVYT